MRRGKRVLEIGTHVELRLGANRERHSTICRRDRRPAAGETHLDALARGDSSRRGRGGGRLRLSRGLRCLSFRGRRLGCVLPCLIRRLASLPCLFFRALRLASRLLELLLRRAEFVLQLLQLPLQAAYLTLDRLDSVDRSLLRVGGGGYDRSTDDDQRATAATARRKFVDHVAAPPLGRHTENLSTQRDSFFTSRAFRAK